MKQLLTPVLAALLILAALQPALAQDATEEPTDGTTTYTDRVITFDYPSAWAVCEACGDRTVSLGNTENALNAASFDEFVEGDVQVLVVKEAETFFARALGVQIDPTLRPDVALTLILPPNTDIEVFEFDDGRLAAEVIFSDPEAGADTIIWLIDLGDNERGAMVITGRTADVTAAEGDLLAIAQSYTLSDIEIVGIEGGEIDLTQTFVNAPGNRRLSYPDGWTIAENTRNVIFFGTSTEALNTQDLTQLEPGEVIGLVYPVAELIPEYPLSGANATPLSVVSFFSSLGIGQGYQQIGEPTPVVLGEYEAAIDFATNDREAHERLVIAVTTGDSVATLLAYTPPGTMRSVRPVLEAMAATIEEGEFEPTAPATEEPDE
ncbi:MAG: hypothetical protein AAFV33_19535 [Chloroflexota bacterium]